MHARDGHVKIHVCMYVYKANKNILEKIIYISLFGKGKIPIYVENRIFKS